ncbi:hypothetical protein PGIN_84-3_00179 [Porphyromonas gingivalis]|nr:hypothetical protein PGIN_84-3_00179 [Porphyromonas gingivalis]
MRRLRAFPFYISIIGLVLFTFYSCMNNTIEEDWTEDITILVASDIVDFYPFENNGIPTKGIKVKEESDKVWKSLPATFIAGFNYESGYEYKLQVLKNHLARHPMDGLAYSYSLKEIIYKKKVVNIP